MRQRRSRRHRTSAGKRLVLTPRDLALFSALCRYRYLRSTYLHAFVGGASETRFKERVGDLFHEGYLDRPVAQWRFADACWLPAVYEIGRGGREALAASAAPVPAAITPLQSGPHRQYEHSLMICEVLASIELGVRDGQGARFISWPEILARAPECTRLSAKACLLSVDTGDAVAPDAVFGIEYRSDERKAYRFFALEADRGTMPLSRADGRQTSLMSKLETYRRVIARQRHRAIWGVPNLIVLTVTVSQARLTNLLAASTRDTDSNPALLFRSLEATSSLSKPCRSLFTEPWQRAGHPPLPIDVIG